MMYKEWLKEEAHVRLRDYKKLSEEEKLNLYTEWLESNKETPTCPSCGSKMLCGYPAWEGRMSYNDLSMAMSAVQAGFGFNKVKVIVPTIHVCMNCGFTGLFLTKNERKLFKNVCCDIAYHER